MEPERDPRLWLRVVSDLSGIRYEYSADGLLWHTLPEPSAWPVSVGQTVILCYGGDDDGV